MNEKTNVISKIKSFFTDHSKAIGVLAVAVVGIAVCRSCGVSGDGAGADSVGDQLRQAGDTQQAITAGIEDAEGRAAGISGKLEQSEAGVNRAEQSAYYIGRNVQDAGELIGDCQRIVREIRQRAEEKNE